MDLRPIVRQVEKTLIDHSPALLTGIGVAGVVATAYLTGRATFKAGDLIREHNRELDITDQYMAPREKFDLIWRLYIPAVGTGLTSIGCIIFANRVGSRRAAAIAAAYSISEEAFREYREKIIEKIGSNRETAARDEIAQERVNRNPPSAIVISGDGDLCYDEFTGRYFRSDMETLRKAQNDINHIVNTHCYASLADFYEMIGLPQTSYSDEVGWNIAKLLELKFSGVLVNGRPCMAVAFDVLPVRDYDRLT